jgi:hypothetical protein
MPRAHSQCPRGGHLRDRCCKLGWRGPAGCGRNQRPRRGGPGPNVPKRSQIELGLANTNRRSRHPGFRRRMAHLDLASEHCRSLRHSESRTRFSRPRRVRDRRSKSRHNGSGQNSCVRHYPGALLQCRHESEGGPAVRENRPAPLPSRCRSTKGQPRASQGSARKGQDRSLQSESSLRAKPDPGSAKSRLPGWAQQVAQRL